MWWQILSAVLDKNGSPAWQKLSGLLSIASAAKGNSAKKTNNALGVKNELS